MAGWALDLGTTNSGVAVWDDSLGRPRLVELPAVCRKPASEKEDPLEAPRLVPSAVHFLEKLRTIDRLGSWPPLASRFFLGQRALIGRPALDRNEGVVHPSFVPTFKPGLSSEALRPLARIGRESITARDAAHAFLRELLREVKRVTGHRVRDLVVTSPVSVFETYRAEVQQALRVLGVRRVRFVDEPVAAALGYGISLGNERTVRRRRGRRHDARRPRPPLAAWGHQRPGDRARQAGPASRGQRRGRLGAAGPLPPDGL